MAKEEMRWNLDDALPVKRFDALFAEIKADLTKYNAFYAKLGPEMGKEDFRAVIMFDEDVSKKLCRLLDMPLLMESADQKSETAKLLKSRAEDITMEHSNISRKLGHWLQGKEIKGKKQLDDKNAERLFSALPDMEYVLHYARESAKYTLTENEERIAAEKSMTGIKVVLDLRELMETEFAFMFRPKGKKPKLIKTAPELVKYVYSKKPEEREAAATALLNKYKENLDKFFMAYQAAVKDWGYEYNMRGYKSPIAVRNHANHVPDKAVEVLLDVCRANKDIYQRYFKFKAKELGMKKLRRYDLYAPLNIAKEQKIPYKEGVRIVLDTFDTFAKGFGDKAREIINKKHIDSHPRQNKRGGAFCSGVVPEIAPYILLNYTGTDRDVSTMAHELGHGIHFLYARRLPLSSQHANLPLCETASTLAEMIVFEKLLEKAKNDKIRKAMLSDKMAESYATILRQAYFVMFEIAAHEAIKKGMTAEQLSGLYFKNLKEQFGDSVDIAPIFRYEWLRIIHIFESPFYCYAYNFGELLSMALFARYKKEGKSFVQKIEKALAYGGSKNPDEVLKEIGVDMRSSQFWEGSFGIVKGWQRRLESY